MAEEEKVDQMTYRFTLTIKVPVLINQLPSHLMMDYFIKTLPYIMNGAFSGKADIKIEEQFEKS